MKEVDMSEAVALLKSYPAYKKQLSSENYAKTYFDKYKTFEELSAADCEKKMDFIKGLITSFAPSNIATLLNLHYINGLTVERCAESMNISRRTAFRLLKRAHAAFYNRYKREIATE